MNEQRIKSAGMTLPELILAVLMLISFTGISLMVTQFTSRFFQPMYEEVNVDNNSSKKELSDILNHHSKINKAIDSIIEILSEPGISKDFILNLKCTSLPSLESEWNIPTINKDAIPRSYKICIKSTSLTESNYSEMINAVGKPGIYILYSKPEYGVSVNATPVRRIFCRPKPFCKS